MTQLEELQKIVIGLQNEIVEMKGFEEALHRILMDTAVTVERSEDRLVMLEKNWE